MSSETDAAGAAQVSGGNVTGFNLTADPGTLLLPTNVWTVPVNGYISPVNGYIQ